MMIVLVKPHLSAHLILESKGLPTVGVAEWLGRSSDAQEVPDSIPASTQDKNPVLVGTSPGMGSTVLGSYIQTHIQEGVTFMCNLLVNDKQQHVWLQQQIDAANKAATS